jgi:hypothetical protein
MLSTSAACPLVPPYGSKTVAEDAVAEDEVAPRVQGVNDLPAEDETPLIQPTTGLPAGEPEGKSVSPSGQMADPQVVQVVVEKIFSPCDRSTPPEPGTHLRNGQPHVPRAQRPRLAPIRRPETPAPETLPVTNDLRGWAANTVPGLPLERERDKFLCYARAHGLTNVDWSEALKWWWLEAHARAVRRGELQLPTAPRPAPAPEPPPLYDVELHAQMQADIVRLCGPTRPSMSRTVERGASGRRHASSILTAESVALERDPAYLAQMQARKAMLQAQVALLQVQAPCVEAAGAAD